MKTEYITEMLYQTIKKGKYTFDELLKAMVKLK